MKAEEYETELKFLYGKAIEQDDISMALELLEHARVMGFECIRKDLNKEKEK